MINFLFGLLGAGFAVAAYIFFIFWRKSSDRIFLFFCLSFCIMAVNQALFADLSLNKEMYVWIYLSRLAAYLLILAGIAAKNRDLLFGKK